MLRGWQLPPRPHWEVSPWLPDQYRPRLGTLAEVSVEDRPRLAGMAGGRVVIVHVTYLVQLGGDIIEVHLRMREPIHVSACVHVPRAYPRRLMPAEPQHASARPSQHPVVRGHAIPFINTLPRLH